jgi:hypothetical protein
MLAACGDTAEQLWKPIGKEPAFTPSPRAIAHEAVAFNIDLLSPPSSERIEVSLPGLGRVTVARTDYEVVGDKQFVWRGKIEKGAAGEVRLSVVNDRLVGDIATTDGRIFSIRSVGPGQAIVEELDPAKLPREDAQRNLQLHVIPGRPTALRMDPPNLLTPARPDPGGLRHVMSSSPGAKTQVDVMVLYTTGAIQFEGDQDAVVARINLAISDTNKSYARSEVHLRVGLAHSEQTSYPEKDDPFLDWNALKASSGIPSLRELNGTRASYAADVVVMLTQPGQGSCGTADQMHSLATASCNEAFAVVPIDCATTVYSFGHEIGHIMGADHNDGASTFSPPFPYSRGFVAASNKWRTIMAYETASCTQPACQRILRWSNPQVSYAEATPGSQQPAQPEPTGSSDPRAPANNAAALNATADMVAGYSDQCASQQAAGA